MTRGEAVVCIPVFGARDLFEQCLRSVVEQTPPGTHVLVADDASPDPEIETFTRRVAEEVAERMPVEYVRREQNLGFVANMNAVFRDTAPADVVIVNSDTVVPAAWLERLRAAAYSDGLVATASTLSNHGTILSVPDRDAPSPLPPPGLSITEADARIARGVAAAAPAHPDRHRALPLHPALGARARRPLRRDVLARLRRGGRLLAALLGARAVARRGRRPLRLPPRRGDVRDAAERAPDRQRAGAQPPLPLLRPQS